MKTERWSSPWLFCVLTFGVTWLCWLPMTLPGRQSNMLVMLLGAAAPGIVGILLTGLSKDGAARREYRRRILGWRRCSLGWTAAILLSYPIMIALAFAAAWLIQGSQPAFPYAAQVLASLSGALVFLITEILGGPVIEEPGWRGFLLPRWQERHGPVWASLMVGATWTAWHLPLFFIPGTIQQAEIGFATPAFTLFVLDIFAWSFLLTYVFERTGQSVPAVMLLHFSHNVTYTIAQVALSPASVYYTLIEVVAACVIAAGWLTAARGAQVRATSTTRLPDS